MTPKPDFVADVLTMNNVASIEKKRFDAHPWRRPQISVRENFDGRLVRVLRI
jgi:hypothetical protein